MSKLEKKIVELESKVADLEKQIKLELTGLIEHFTKINNNLVERIRELENER